MSERHLFDARGVHVSVDCARDQDAEHVHVESAVVHDATISLCPLCGVGRIDTNVWYVLGETNDRCSGCLKRLGPEHVICSNCGGHITKAVA